MKEKLLGDAYTGTVPIDKTYSVTGYQPSSVHNLIVQRAETIKPELKKKASGHQSGNSNHTDLDRDQLLKHVDVKNV